MKIVSRKHARKQKRQFLRSKGIISVHRRKILDQIFSPLPIQQPSIACQKVWDYVIAWCVANPHLSQIKNPIPAVKIISENP